MPPPLPAGFVRKPREAAPAAAPRAYRSQLPAGFQRVRPEPEPYEATLGETLFGREDEGATVTGVFPSVLQSLKEWGPTLEGLPTDIGASLASAVAGMKAAELAKLEQGSAAAAALPADSWMRHLGFSGTPEEAAELKGLTETEIGVMKAAQEDLKPREGENIGQRSLRTAVQSVAQNAPGMAAALVTRSPTVGAGMMYPTTAGPKTAELIDLYGEQALARESWGYPAQTEEERLGDYARAQVHGRTQGAIEVLTEIAPLGKVLVRGTPIVKRLAEVMLAELPGESLATIGQSIDDVLAESPEGATAQELLTGLIRGGKQLPETWVSTILGAGAQTAIGSLASPAVPAPVAAPELEQQLGAATDLTQPAPPPALPPPGPMQVTPAGDVGRDFEIDAAVRAKAKRAEDLGLGDDIVRNLAALEERKQAAIDAQPELKALAAPDETMYVDAAGRAGRDREVAQFLAALEQQQQQRELERQQLGLTPDVLEAGAQHPASAEAVRPPITPQALPAPDPALYVDQQEDAATRVQREALERQGRQDAQARADQLEQMGFTADVMAAGQRHPGAPRPAERGREPPLSDDSGQQPPITPATGPTGTAVAPAATTTPEPGIGADFAPLPSEKGADVTQPAKGKGKRTRPYYELSPREKAGELATELGREGAIARVQHYIEVNRNDPKMLAQHRATLEALEAMPEPGLGDQIVGPSQAESADVPQNENVQPPQALPPGFIRKKRPISRGDETKEDALEFIAAKGGINLKEAIAQGFDRKDLSSFKGFRRPFTKAGMSFDTAAELLDEAGYPVRNDEGAYDLNKVVELIDRAIRGEKTFSSRYKPPATEKSKDRRAEGFDDRTGIERRQEIEPFEGAERRKADDRRAQDRRKPVRDMTPEEMAAQLHTSDKTGLRNRRAFDEGTRLPAISSLDIDGLGWINDTYGHTAGDLMLEAVGKVIRKFTPHGYHFSGDEFVVEAESDLELEEVMQAIDEALARSSITVTNGDEEIELEGISLSYGTGANYDEADADLRSQKEARRRQGLRAAKGQKPPGTIERSRGRQDSAGQSAAGIQRAEQPDEDLEGEPDRGFLDELATEDQERELEAAATPEEEAEPESDFGKDWTNDLPDRSGLYAYTSGIMSQEDSDTADDFTKKKRAKAKLEGPGKGPGDAWKGVKKTPIAIAQPKILEYLRSIKDDRPVTLTRIAQDLFNTAEGIVISGENPETALWNLVEAGDAQWRHHPDGFIEFRAASKGEKSAENVEPAAGDQQAKVTQARERGTVKREIARMKDLNAGIRKHLDKEIIDKLRRGEELTDAENNDKNRAIQKLVEGYAITHPMARGLLENGVVGYSPEQIKAKRKELARLEREHGVETPARKKKLKDDDFGDPDEGVEEEQGDFFGTKERPTWSSSFTITKRGKHGGGYKTRGGDQLDWSGFFKGKKVAIRSFVRLTDPSIYFMTPSNARIAFDPGKRWPDHYVDLLVLEGDLTDKELGELADMAADEDPRAVTIRRKGERIDQARAAPRSDKGPRGVREQQGDLFNGPDVGAIKSDTERWRDETNAKQKKLARELLDALENHEEGDAKTLATAIATDFKEDGTASLLGRSIHNTAELALLGQIFRNPRYETLRYFFLDKNNRVIAESAVSSRLPGSASAFPAGKDLNWISNRFKEVGAVGIRLLHNHPSGIAQPSTMDIGFTQNLALHLGQPITHVVIDSNEYGRIMVNKFGEPMSVERIPHPLIASEQDPLLTPSKPHPLLGYKLKDSIDLFNLGSEIKKPGYVAIIGTAGVHRQVRTLGEIPAHILDNRERLEKALRRFAVQNGTGELYLTEIPHGQGMDLKSMFRGLVEDGYIGDAVTTGGTSLIRGVGYWRTGKSFGVDTSAVSEDVTPKGRRAEQQADLLGADKGKQALHDAKIAKDKKRNPDKVVGPDTGAPGDLFTTRTQQDIDDVLKAKKKTPRGLDVVVSTSFASGMGSDADFLAALKSGVPFGVDIGLLTKERRDQVARAVAKGHKVFVDSGAFRVFNEGQKAKNDKQLEAFGEQFKAIDDNVLMRQYQQMSDAAYHGEGADPWNLSVVMPDVLGNAEATLHLVLKHKAAIIRLLEDGNDVIIPVQADKNIAPAAFARRVARILTDAPTNVRWGIPSNAEAMSDDELTEFVRAVDPARLHILGAVQKDKLAPRLKAIKAGKNENSELDVSADGNILRSSLDELAGLTGVDRSEKLAEILKRKLGDQQGITAGDLGVEDRAPAGWMQAEASRDDIATIPEMKEAVRAMFHGAKNAPTVEFVDKIPAEFAHRFKETPGMQWAGAFDPVTGRVLLNTNAVYTVADATWNAAHEIDGHLGLRGLLAKGDVTREARRAIDKELARAAKNATVDGLATAISDRRRLSYRQSVEEALAELQAAIATDDFGELNRKYGIGKLSRALTNRPEAKTKLRRVIDRFLERVQAIFERALGYKVGDAAIRKLLDDARRYVREGEAPSKKLDEAARKELGIEQAEAFHGSAHKGINEFRLDKIGSGEGAHAYGYGLYFASSAVVGNYYRRTIAGDEPLSSLTIAGRTMNQANNWDYSPGLNDAYDNARSTLIENVLIGETDMRAIHATRGDKGVQAHVIADVEKMIRDYEKEGFPEEAEASRKLLAEVKKPGGVKVRMGRQPGAIYTVDISDAAIETMVDWDKPMAAQPKIVRDFAKANGLEHRKDGQSLYHGMLEGTAHESENWKEASEKLRAAGIKGIRYLDQLSRDQDEAKKTTNYVLFDPADVTVKAINGRKISPAASKAARLKLSEELDEGGVDKMLEKGDETAQRKVGERIARRMRVLKKIEAEPPTLQFDKAFHESRVEQLEDQIFTALDQYRELYGDDALEQLSQRLKRDEDLDIGEFLLNEVALNEKTPDLFPESFPEDKEQTETTKFQRWFKKSKVSRRGEPYRVYHATAAENDFEIFTQSFDIGFHFGTAQSANDRIQSTADESDAPVRIIPVFLSIQNPLRLPDLESWDPEDVFAALHDKGLVSDADFDRNDRSTRPMSAARVIRIIEAAGYDGIVYLNEHEGVQRRGIPRSKIVVKPSPPEHSMGGKYPFTGYYEDRPHGAGKTEAEALKNAHRNLRRYKRHRQDSWIAFHPEQIKSAIANNGEYSADPRIQLNETEIPEFDQNKDPNDAKLKVALAEKTEAIEKSAPPGSVLETYLTRGREIYVSLLYVTRGERGQGAGTAMMTELLDFADEHGLQVALHPEAEQLFKKKALHRFYTALGFKRNGSRGHYDAASAGSWFRKAKAPRESDEDLKLAENEIGDEDTLLNEAADRRVGQRRTRARAATGRRAGEPRVPSKKGDRGYRKLAQRALDLWDRKVGWRYGALGRLPEKLKYLEERYRALGRVTAGQDIGREIYTALNQASELDQQRVYDYLTNQGGDPHTIENADVRRAAIKAKTLIDKVGQRLVEAGMLSEEAYQAHAGEYLPRLYLKHLLGDRRFSAIGSGKRLSDLGYLKQRQDIPEEVRKVLLGEITDPAFLASFGLTRTLRDLALIDFLNAVAAHKTWTPEGATVEWNGRQVSPFWLADEATQLRRRARLYEPDSQAKAMKVADAMDVRVDAALELLGKPDVKDYEQIPNSKKYGALRGLWVRREIYNDLVGAQNFLPRGEESLAERLLGQGGALTKVTRGWKMSKVVLNPPTQVRNFIGNMVLLHLSGVPARRVYSGELIGKAIRSIVKKDRYYQIAKKFGLFATTFANQEGARISEEWIRAQDLKGGSLAKMMSFFSRVSNFASDVYGLMEAIAKIAKLRDAMDRQGKSPAEAMLEAHETLFDYSLVPRSVQYLRNQPLGAPFITFMYKSLAQMSKTAVKYPERFALYAGVPLLLAELLKQAFDVDDDDIEKLKKAFPRWMKERGHMLLLPWKDDQDRWQVADMGYLVPWGQFADLAAAAREGKGAKEALNLLVFGGPLTDVSAAIDTNIDPFTGREIVNPADPPEDKLRSMMLYVWNMAMPGFLTEQGALNRFRESMTGEHGKVNVRNEPGQNPYQAAARLFGLNVYPVDPEATRAANLRSMRYELEEGKARRAELLKDKNLTPTERRELAEQWRKILADRTKQLADYARESQIPANLKTN